MPASVAKALAESPGTPDVPWQPAQSIARHGIAPADLRAAIEALTPPPVNEAHAARCFARLLVAFEPSTRSTPEETRLRLGVWLEANSDLGDALWTRATLDAIRTAKYMPRPSEFRALVSDALDAQAANMARCRRMLAAIGKKETVFVPEPREVRLATIRDAWRRHGNDERAAKAERELAKLEQRAPAEWVLESK